MDSAAHDGLTLAKSKKRPRSRASTASLHSVSTQQNLEHGLSGPSMFSAEWLPHQQPPPPDHSQQQQHRDLAPALSSHLTPEDLLIASHLQANRDFSVAMADPSMHNAAMSFHQSHNMSREPLSADSFAANTSFDDSQMMDRDLADDPDSFMAMPASNTAKPSSRSLANNEMEMRQLFVANKNRRLQEVAEELHGNERGPNSEKTRQVFAMLWINLLCSKGKGSVPRSRVYANYASRCATERITVLNPASFGKLVRVLFPGLKTRRLGVRGESKYHYVNFSMIEEQPEGRDMPQAPQAPTFAHILPRPPHMTMPSNSVSMRSEPAAFPTPDLGQGPDPDVPRVHEFAHSFYNQPVVDCLDQLQSTSTRTGIRLSFVSEQFDSANQLGPLILPEIQPFLPSGTDSDVAISLAALYRSHCTSLVECIRYCKEKTFFHLFTSFQGTLTMPVHKLFGNPALARWIEESDFAMYHKIMGIISSLTLQVVPKPVLDTLRSISGRLVLHIRESFEGQPLHVVRAKEAPATIFAALLDRALRVNLTAHAAANMLSNPANRDLMYAEWIEMINVRKIAECIPSRAMDDVVGLLLSEMRDLLDPVDVSWDLECGTLHGEMAVRKGGLRMQGEDRPTGETTASNVLERWVAFFRSLPSHFPYASHTDIVWCVQRLGTTVMRDLTLVQGKSFGSWWVTKCWIDEMIQFMAEEGGFLQTKTTHQQQQQQQQRRRRQQAGSHSLMHVSGQRHQGHNNGGSYGSSNLVINSRDISNQPGSRYSSASDDFNVSRLSQSQPDRATFPSNSSSHRNRHTTSGAGDVDEDDNNNNNNDESQVIGHSNNNNHDDSGIGIRTPDEELPGESKYVGFTPTRFTPSNGHDMFVGDELQEHLAHI